MCGIFGTNNAERALMLYKLNSNRGKFAYGLLEITHDHHVSTTQSPGEWDGHVSRGADLAYICGHTQAPTSANREFAIETAHPFSAGNYILAHNGVLTNWKSDKYDALLDSHAIALKLAAYEKSPYASDAVRDVSDSLEGTFGCWIYHTGFQKLFVVRSGSTIWMKGCEFSSVKPDEPGWSEVKEGVVYMKDSDEDTFRLGHKLFEVHSGFFI